MKKFLIGLTLALTASTAADAAGLYISAGYGKSNPDMKISNTTDDTSYCLSGSTWDDTCFYAPFQHVAGFPNGDVLAGYNSSTGIGYQAADWPEGLKEDYDIHTKGTNTLSFAVGWDLSQNPFRFELEYQKTKFKSSNWSLIVHDPEGVYFSGMYENNATAPYTACVDSICINANEVADPNLARATSSYKFDMNLGRDLTATMNSLMANVYFEIPGLGPVDPYVGFGYGKSKLNYTLHWPIDGDHSDYASGDDGSDGYKNAHQFILGVEYRFDQTPLIAGLEYRMFKTKFSGREDSSDKYDLDHKYIMLKLRYDFISDRF